MFQTNCCNCKCRCSVAALIASAILGVLGTFLQITGVITVTTAFLWVAFGIAVVYLGILTAAAIIAKRTEPTRCRCSSLDTLLIGILGTILLAVGITATSIITAILVGLLVFFLFLIFFGIACCV